MSKKVPKNITKLAKKICLRKKKVLPLQRKRHKADERRRAHLHSITAYRGA